MYMYKSINTVKDIFSHSEILDTFNRDESPLYLKNALFNVNRDIKELIGYGGQFFICKVTESNKNSSKNFLSPDLFEDNRINSILKLSCLFPGRVIIVSDLNSNRNPDSIADIKSLYTHSFDYIEKGMFYVWTAQLTSKTVNINHLTKFLTKTENENGVLNSIQLCIPWLYNARPNDYLELIGKYDSAFQNFRNQIDKLSRVALSKEELTKSFVNEYTYALNDMRIALEKKMNELKTKGLQTFFGFAFTAIPFFIPSHIINVDPELLSSIFGAVTLNGELIPLVKDVHELRALRRESVYSILFEWQKNKTKK